MKVIFRSFAAIFIVLASVSCSVDDEINTFHVSYQLTPIVETDIPDTLFEHQTYDFTISYEKPSDCYSFSGFDFSEEGNKRIIGAVSSVIKDGHCSRFGEPEIETSTLQFRVKQSDFYLFKFWIGEDDKGNPQYSTKRVEVIKANQLEKAD